MTPAESAERSYLLARLADVTAERGALAAQVQAVRAETAEEIARAIRHGDCRVVGDAVRIARALADAPGTEDA